VKGIAGLYKPLTESNLRHSSISGLYGPQRKVNTMFAIIDRFNAWFLIKSFGSANRSGAEKLAKATADAEYRRRVTISGSF
jgi:hypothetical protein